MKIGDCASWLDVEGDEATFCKSIETGGDTSKPVRWEQWLGLVERGRPEFHSRTLNPAENSEASSGSGAVHKVESQPLGRRHLQGRCVVFHADSAKSYKLHLEGAVHDNVIHARKRVMVNRRWVWKPPTYVQVPKHSIPGRSKPLRVKSGTQIVDRAWRLIKDRIALNQS